MKRVLTIAGSDSGGGAGIQADLKTFTAYGVYGMSVITAITAQNSREVRSIAPVPAEVIRDQIDCVLEDFGADAVKTGMLFTAEVVEVVADALTRHRPPHVIVDPVMVSKSGARLLDPDAEQALRERLFPLAETITPNLPEAEAILGSAFTDGAPNARGITNRAAMEKAAEALLELGPEYVLLKGGHLTGDPVDLLLGRKLSLALEGTRIDTSHTHGTGCTLSSALAAGRALGMRIEEAFRVARDYVLDAIRAAPHLGSGSGPLRHGVKPRLKGRPPFDGLAAGDLRGADGEISS